ncbi:MAG: hypothetical protein NXI04_24205 [Planctomycetaceae bacterium]|nr:hypothetical protein [Planctomycetaceae bacterium]
MLAMYVPKPFHFVLAVAVLVSVFLVLCALAGRWKMSVGIAACCILGGGGMMVMPDLISIWNADLSQLGSIARESSSTTYSDRFFAFTCYFYGGRGAFLAASGMTAGLIFHAAMERLVGRSQDDSHGQAAASE